MRRICLLAGLVAPLLAASAWALPPIPAYVKDSLAGSADHEAFAKTLAGLKTKCDVCHKPGVDKKAKGHGLNDFGQAFHKHLDDKQFMALHKEKKADEALALIKEAWAKTEAEKNAAGKTYGELIKAGSLPGKND